MDLLILMGAVFLVLAFLSERYIRDVLLMKIVVIHCMGLSLFLGFVAAAVTNPGGVVFLITGLVFTWAAHKRPTRYRPRLVPVRN